MRFISVLTLLLLASMATGAYACTCSRSLDKEFLALPSSHEALVKYVYDKTDVILRGRIVRIDVVRQPSDLAAARKPDERFLPPHLLGYVEVIELFKGPVDHKYFYSLIGAAACAGPMVPGEEHYYLASFDKFGRAWVHSSCFYSQYVYPLDPSGPRTENVWRQLRTERGSQGHAPASSKFWSQIP